VAVELLGAAGRPPARLRVRAADVGIELTWPSGPAGPAAPAAAPAGVAEVARPVEAPAADTHLVRAPSPGTFHRSPAPGAEPFAAVGDVVRTGQQVAILEAMKLMLPVEADRPGRVVEVLAADGQSVEFGEPLLALAPDGG
jgi:acetyl-CoA carboxylase biotin carboxyl carrier protein